MAASIILAQSLFSPFPATPAVRRLAGMDGLETSDETLMLAYAAGEVGAFDPLYARHRGKV